jgi:hypothetical protein
MSRFYGIVSRELDVEKSFVQPLSLIRKFPSSGAQLTENGRLDGGTLWADMWIAVRRSKMLSFVNARTRLD